MRHEWASLVTTPTHAAFQDALAFTRSLGDFHLQTYGVSHEPEVFTIALNAGISSLAGATAGALVLCSDGVWDNWTYEDVADWILDPERVATLAKDADAQVKLTTAFMDQNIVFALANFGSSADNMTAIVCYLDKM